MAKTNFSDVQDERWSAAAIRQAQDDGILQGFEDGTFRPTEALTREQMAVVYTRIKTQIQKLIDAGFTQG